VFLETLRCENGDIAHLSYHQYRLDITLNHFGIPPLYDLKYLIVAPKEGLYRCRFLYNAEGFSIEFHPYLPKSINTLKLIHADSIDYPFKYSDRTTLNTLYDQREECDDVLIVKNGYLSDTTLANIALYDGTRWLTPDKPLLEGTTRARLIHEGFLFPAPLPLDAVLHAKKVAVFNALMGFVEVEHGIII